eukprot:TRINITY_DN90657_c0_g1_i1.p1 TRINITY_DN90657_c0_g1~~TRINITY_DN90657_c0_g1_i1.p1  ORF type:complete len:890 (+),score=142.83 TRINITY_DN90657_c0_g1_i1:160-2829(+)
MHQYALRTQRCVAFLVVVAVAGLQEGSESSASHASLSAGAVKARVEAGEGVPYFDERLSCRDDNGIWSDFKDVVQYSRLRIYEAEEGEDLAKLLAEHLAARTSNLTYVMQCNVGVIAAYHLLARRYVAIGDDWKAYRLLQLALIWVFTLRNALTVPPEAAHEWATSTDAIVREIKLLKTRLIQEQVRRVERLPTVSPDYRIPDLRVAVVSICAYPEGHPLDLRLLTPENRRLYTERHGYGMHVHMVHPLPGRGIHIQHAKLQLMANYLKSGEYDWVAWLDCDSIVMNLNRTLDSVIYRYARQSARPHLDEPAEWASDSGEDETSRFLGHGAKQDQRHRKSGRDTPGRPVGREDVASAVDNEVDRDEPLPDEVIEAFVTHLGSCNTPEGCHGSTRIKVNRQASYEVSVRAALIDMVDDNERISSLVVAGMDMGECNPNPDSDYDCGMYPCVRSAAIPQEAVENGSLLLEARSVRTSADCRCNRILGGCMNAAVASFEEAAGGEKMVDPGYGMFVKFTLTPKSSGVADDGESVQRQKQRPVKESGFKEQPSSMSGHRDSAETPLVDKGELCSPESAAPSQPFVNVSVWKMGAECSGHDLLLGKDVTIDECLMICHELDDCEFVAYGYGQKLGQCFWELSDCSTFEEDSYTVYRFDRLSGNKSYPEDHASLETHYEVPDWGLVDDIESESSAILDAATAEDPDEALEERSLLRSTHENSVDLLITEEGWGMSSANWLIRSSDWSIRFLERAFKLCQDEMPLFGDQDAMIHLVLNDNAVKDEVSGDPLDPHVVVVPQRELNAYDALNAHYMTCDAYEEGDLLVTFPGCKDPGACNPLFRMAAAHAKGEEEVEDAEEEGHRLAQQARKEVARIRLFGPPEAAAAFYEQSRRMRS